MILARDRIKLSQMTIPSLGGIQRTLRHAMTDAVKEPENQSIIWTANKFLDWISNQ
jgi:hypothetical protein